MLVCGIRIDLCLMAHVHMANGSSICYNFSSSSSTCSHGQLVMHILQLLNLIINMFTWPMFHPYATTPQTHYQHVHMANASSICYNSSNSLSTCSHGQCVINMLQFLNLIIDRIDHTSNKVITWHYVISKDSEYIFL